MEAEAEVVEAEVEVLEEVEGMVQAQWIQQCLFQGYTSHPFSLSTLSNIYLFRKIPSKELLHLIKKLLLIW